MGGVSIALSRVTLIAALLLPAWAALAQTQINQQFVPQGPAPSVFPADPTAGTPASSNSGAVQAILPDMALGANTVFVGTTNGGIWRSTNISSSQPSWQALTDNQASLSIASLGLDTTDASGKTLIAGIGLTSNASNPWLGADGAGAAPHGGARTGVLYSTDGGQTWISPAGNATLSNMSVVGVAARGSTVLAATFEPKSTILNATPGGAAYGLYLSTNSGQSFNLVSSGLPSGPVTSLVADPSNNNIFYAAVKPVTTGSSPSIYQGTLSGSGSSASISWTLVPSASQFSTGDFLRLAAGPNGSLAVGVIVQCTTTAPCSSTKTGGNTSGFAVGSLLWSPTPGTSSSWATIAAPSGSSWQQSLNNIAQASVNFAIAIGPSSQTASQTVYVSGDEAPPPSGSMIGTLPVYSITCNSTNNNNTCSTATSITGSNTSDNSNAHTDSRALVIIPTGSAAGQLLLGSDGGIYQQTSPQGTTGQWLQSLNNLQTGESYVVAYGANAQALLVARQDNGIALQTNNLSYRGVQGADGHTAAVNDTTFNTTSLGNVSAFYSANQGLGAVNIKRLIVDSQGNTQASQDVTCNPGCGSLIPSDGNSLAFVLNRANPTGTTTGSGGQSYIAIGGQQGTGIYVTQDTNPIPTLPCPNSGCPSITLNLTNAGYPTGNMSAYTSALAYGTPNNPFALLAGVTILDSNFEVQSGQIWFSPNVPVSGTGTSLSEPTTSTGALAYTGSAPSSVVFDPTSSSSAIKYYVVDGTNLYGAQYTASTATTSFSPISLPTTLGFTSPTALEFISNNGVNALLVGGINTPITCNAGTPNGCVVSTTQSPIIVANSNTLTGNPNWSAFGTGLPNALVTQMSYNPIVDVLAIATAGRGAWTLYDVTSYFPQATALQFGLANNDSKPDASHLTDGTTGGRPLNKYGTGTLTIAGDATYTGGTTIYGGKVNLGDGGTGGGSIRGNVAFCNDSSNSLCDTSTNKILAFNRSDTYTFAGTIAGPGQVQQNGFGKTILTGASTYTGPTTISTGTLEVDGSITSTVNVNGDGELLGTGSVGSTTVNAFLSPGNGTVGTLTVAGDLKFNRGSFYVVNAAPGAGNLTNVTGTATLAGTAIAVLHADSLARSYTILSAAGGRSGTFDAFTPIGLSSSVRASLGYTATDVTLNLTAQIAQVPGLSGNQSAVGSVLNNAFNTFGTLPGGLNALFALSPSALAGALAQLSGQSQASQQTVLANQGLAGRSTILSRLRAVPYTGSTGPEAALAYAGPEAISMDDGDDSGAPLAYASTNKPTAMRIFPIKDQEVSDRVPVIRGLTFWAQGLGGWGKVNGNPNAAGTTGTFAGVLSGADVRLPNNWLVGMAFGYSQSNTSAPSIMSSASVDTGLFAAYAATSVGPFNLRMGGTYGLNEINSTRSVAFPGFMDRDTARYNAGTGQAFGEVGYGTAIGSVAVEPFAGLAWVHLNTAGFTESGGAAALTAAASAQDTGYSSLGMRAAVGYYLPNGMMLVPRGSLAWQYAFGELNPASSLAFATLPGTNFSALGVPIARNSALIDVGADLRINPQAKIGLYYSGQHANSAHENAVRGTIAWNF
jgi:outer membrane autotransporter protein